MCGRSVRTKLAPIARLPVWNAGLPSRRNSCDLHKS
jgi:hypothetical protein